MTEEFLSFIWQNKLYNPAELSIDGEKITVLHPGEINRDSGPDFFNTKIRVGNTVWVGNAEIHIRASDWNRHYHNTDPAFDNVILHIALVNDETVYNSKGRVVPAIELNFRDHLFKKYKTLLSNHQVIPCADEINDPDPVIIRSFLNRIGIERLEYRSEQISESLGRTVNDWEEVFYRCLARSYGFHLNSLPFESLAVSLPYAIVKKHRQNLTQLEALFFGQAGFLHNDYSSDGYYNTLKKEYQFLQTKYSLQPIDTHLWKFMRLRPRNFPGIRIAQFVSVIHHNTDLISSILEAADVQQLIRKFTVDISGFWEDHYAFGDQAITIKKRLGPESAQNIIINTVVPFLFNYGKKMGLRHLQEKALAMLEDIPPEKNSVIRHWTKIGIKPKNAFESQALLQLKNCYCDQKNCLGCSIGVKIISRAPL